MGGGVCAAFDAQALCKIAGLVGWQSRWRPPGAARRGKQPLSSAVVAAADAPTTCACRARRLSSSSPSSSSPTVVVRRRRRRQRHLQPEIRSDPFPPPLFLPCRGRVANPRVTVGLATGRFSSTGPREPIVVLRVRIENTFSFYLSLSPFSLFIVLACCMPSEGQ